ncbi:transposase [Bacillota bacterium LX-D]|nr:transposase [Bacillota bacterium LX-D]
MGRKSKASFEEKLNAVEDYLNGINTIEQISTALHVSRYTILQWISKYQTYGPIGLQSLPQNTCYHSDLKIQAVTDYLEGRASQYEICKKYHISSHSVLQRWIKSYNGHETMKSHNSKGDKHMTSGKKTTYEERVEIISFCIANNDNYQLTAEKFGVSYQQVYTWTKKYKEDGSEALTDQRGKRKDLEEMTETQKLTAQVKLLEAENNGYRWRTAS